MYISSNKFLEYKYKYFIGKNKNNTSLEIRLGTIIESRALRETPGGGRLYFLPLLSEKFLDIVFMTELINK